MAKIKNCDNTKSCQGWEGTTSLIHYWWEYKMVKPLQKNSLTVFVFVF